MIKCAYSRRSSSYQRHFLGVRSLNVYSRVLSSEVYEQVIHIWYLGYSNPRFSDIEHHHADILVETHKHVRSHCWSIRLCGTNLCFFARRFARTMVEVINNKGVAPRLTFDDSRNRGILSNKVHPTPVPSLSSECLPSGRIELVCDMVAGGTVLVQCCAITSLAQNALSFHLHNYSSVQTSVYFVKQPLLFPQAEQGRPCLPRIPYCTQP